MFGVTAAAKGALGTPGESRLQLVVSARLPDVVDLTAAAVLTLLGVSRGDITAPNDPLDLDAIGRPRAYEFPQCIGELANELGVGAFRYPSVPARGGANVVIFTEHLAATGGWYEWTDPVSGTVDRWP